MTVSAGTFLNPVAQTIFAPPGSSILTTPAAPPQPIFTPLVLFCTGLGALSGISTDIMLPAFSDMAASLNTPIDRVQTTVSIFALFFGIGQIFYGPLSDKFGRKPSVALGMLVFIVGAVISALATNIETMLIGRALQGLGCGAGPVVSRAILRDTHSGIPLARAMATTFAIFGLGPVFAPLIGHFLNLTYNWRLIFLFIGLLSTILLAYDLLRFQETIHEKKQNALNPRFIFTSVRTVMGNTQSRYFIACACAAYCSLFVYIANAPVVYEVSFGTSGLHFASLFAFTGIGIIIGQTMNRIMLPRFGVLTMLKIASAILFISTGSIVLCDWTNILNAVVFTGLMFFFNTSFLVIVSNTASLTLDPHPTIAGLTSAFFGFATNFIASSFIFLTAKFIGGDVTKWSTIMVILTGTAATLIWAPTARRVLKQA